MFSFFDIILLAGFSQGVFLVAALIVSHQRNKEANSFLALALTFSALMLLGRVLIFKTFSDWVSYVAIIVDTTIFLFGPLYYLYLKKLLFKNSEAYSSSLYPHFIFAGTHLLYALAMISLSLYQNKSFSSISFTGLTGFIVESLGLLSFAFYTIKTGIVLKNHSNQSKYTISYNLSVRKFAITIFVAMLIFTILWMASFITTYFLRIYNPFLNYNVLWIAMPLFIYAVGYFSLKQPEIFRIPELPVAKKGKARLKPQEIQQLQKRLHYYMGEEQIYQEPDLSLHSLAAKLQTTPNNLSWLLNQVYQKTFYDYINGYRIKDVLNCIDLEMHKDQTLLALAYDAGFNSKSTFNKAFKGVTGQTPSAYIKSKNVA